MYLLKSAGREAVLFAFSFCLAACSSPSCALFLSSYTATVRCGPHRKPPFGAKGLGRVTWKAFRPYLQIVFSMFYRCEDFSDEQTSSHVLCLLVFQMLFEDTCNLHHLPTNICADSLDQLCLLFPALPPALFFILISRFRHT